MEYLECDRCHRKYTDRENVEWAKKEKSKWEQLVRKDGDEPRGIAPCPNINCPGELVLLHEEVTVTKPDGTQMTETEAANFLKRLQAGVLYIPQERR